MKVRDSKTPKVVVYHSFNEKETKVIIDQDQIMRECKRTMKMLHPDKKVEVVQFGGLW